MIRTRGYRKQDFTGLYELDRICFLPGIAYSISDLRHFLASPHCFCRIAEVGEETAGFILVEREVLAGRTSGHIITIDVHPQMRRRGIGALLIHTAETQLKDDGASLVRLEVAENNGGAQAFYDRLGFAAAGRIPGYYGGTMDARVMRKIL